jgi:hypothetical protein
MALAPLLLEHLADVVRVQRQVQRVVRRVDVADFAAGDLVDRVARVQGQAVLLERRLCDAKLFRQPARHRCEQARQGGVVLLGPELVGLALGREAGDGGARADAEGEPRLVARKEAHRGDELGRGGRRREWVAERKEPKPLELEVAARR